MSTAPELEVSVKTILVVEDNMSARMALEALLDALGYRVLVAADGAEAETVFAGHADAIDLMLTDLLLPQITGPELYVRFKEQKPDLRCVLMSGYPLEDSRAKLHSQGITRWLQKPFSLNEVKSTMEAALGD